MNIAYIVPSLAAKAPIFLTKRLSDYFLGRGDEVAVFYFDEIEEVVFNCQTQKIAMNEQIDFDSYHIIHSHMMRPDKYVAKHSHLITKAKTISTIHCDIYDDLKWSYGRIVSCIYTRRWLKWLSKFNATVQINDYLFDLYQDILPNNVLIYNGVSISLEPDDYSAIREQIQEYRKRNLRILCSYSGVIKRKGLLQILMLLERRPDLCYICIGDGDFKSTLMSFVEKNRLADRVFFSPFKTNPYLILPDVDVFVLPSYSEGFSLSLLEAGSIGCSVVCSHIPSTALPFTQSEVSFFELEDIDTLSISVDEAIDRATEKKSNLKKKIEEKYSESLMFQRYGALYTSPFGDI